MKGMLKLFAQGTIWGAGCAIGYFGFLYGPAVAKELKKKAEDKLRKKFTEKEKDLFEGYRIIRRSDGKEINEEEFEKIES